MFKFYSMYIQNAINSKLLNTKLLFPGILNMLQKLEQVFPPGGGGWVGGGGGGGGTPLYGLYGDVPLGRVWVLPL